MSCFTFETCTWYASHTLYLAENHVEPVLKQGWLVVTLLATTIVEAFTDEIDNLLLPAFSACVYLVGVMPAQAFYGQLS